MKQLLPRIEAGPHKMKGKENGECVPYLHIGGHCKGLNSSVNWVMLG